MTYFGLSILCCTILFICSAAAPLQGIFPENPDSKREITEILTPIQETQEKTPASTDMVHLPEAAARDKRNKDLQTFLFGDPLYKVVVTDGKPKYLCALDRFSPKNLTTDEVDFVCKYIKEEIAEESLEALKKLEPNSFICELISSHDGKSAETEALAGSIGNHDPVKFKEAINSWVSSGDTPVPRPWSQMYIPWSSEKPKEIKLEIFELVINDIPSKYFVKLTKQIHDKKDSILITIDASAGPFSDLQKLIRAYPGSGAGSSSLVGSVVSMNKILNVVLRVGDNINYKLENLGLAVMGNRQLKAINTKRDNFGKWLDAALSNQGIENGALKLRDMVSQIFDGVCCRVIDSAAGDEVARDVEHSIRSRDADKLKKIIDKWAKGEDEIKASILRIARSTGDFTADLKLTAPPEVYFVTISQGSPPERQILIALDPSREPNLKGFLGGSESILKSSKSSIVDDKFIKFRSIYLDKNSRRKPGDLASAIMGFPASKAEYVAGDPAIMPTDGTAAKVTTSNTGIDKPGDGAIAAQARPNPGDAFGRSAPDPEKIDKTIRAKISKSRSCGGVEGNAEVDSKMTAEKRAEMGMEVRSKADIDAEVKLRTAVKNRDSNVVRATILDWLKGQKKAQVKLWDIFETNDDLKVTLKGEQLERKDNSYQLLVEFIKSDRPDWYKDENTNDEKISVVLEADGALAEELQKMVCGLNPNIIQCSNFSTHRERGDYKKGTNCKHAIDEMCIVVEIPEAVAEKANNESSGDGLTTRFMDWVSSKTADFYSLVIRLRDSILGLFTSIASLFKKEEPPETKTPDAKTTSPRELSSNPGPNSAAQESAQETLPLPDSGKSIEDILSIIDKSMQT